jgi:integrase
MSQTDPALDTNPLRSRTEAAPAQTAGHPYMGPLGAADAHVFPSDRGGILRTSNFRAKVWLPAIRAAGLAPLRPHDLRHTAVALWIAAGANPRKSACTPGTRRSASRWTATATCSKVTTLSCATGSTPCWPTG